MPIDEPAADEIEAAAGDEGEEEADVPAAAAGDEAAPVALPAEVVRFSPIFVALELSDHCIFTLGGFKIPLSTVIISARPLYII